MEKSTPRRLALINESSCITEVVVEKDLPQEKSAFGAQPGAQKSTLTESFKEGIWMRNVVA